MNLERDIKKLALTLIVDNAKTRKIKRKDINSIICLGIKIKKEMAYNILKELEKDGEIEMNSKYVTLMHDLLS
jgi:hypothetical protein